MAPVACSRPLSPWGRYNGCELSRRAHLCKPEVCVRSGLRPDTPVTPMAIFHLSVKTISRSAGRTATAAAAYRAGARITDERTGEIHDYGRKRGIESATLIVPDNAPEWARDRHLLWNAAEQAERRRNSTVAREFEIALPADLSPEGRAELAHDFARRLVKTHRCAADVCIHAPSRGGDQRNYHAHILLTTRRLGPDGLAEKTRELDDQTTGPELVKLWRETFAVLQNAWLQRAGLASRVDHRTLEAQGVARPATRHLGPAATGFERKTGRPSHRRRISSAPGRRQCQALAQQVQQHAAALAEADADVGRLSQELAAAQAERERAEAQARAAREAAALEARRRAKAEAAERRAREERERIEAMSSRELAAEIERIRPGDPSRLAEADSTVIEARTAVERLSEQREGAAKAKALAERQEAAWRRQHAYKARMHDSGLWRSSELDDLAEQQETAQTRLDEVGPRLVRAQEKLRHVRTVAQARITDEQRPAWARVAELEEIHHGKVVQERIDAGWRARQAQERAERNQVLNDFESLAAYRRNRFHGFRDGGRQWEATPGPLRELVDRFNAMTGAQQLETLEVLGRDHDRNARLGELLRDRAQAIELDQEQDRGLSF